MKHFTRVVVLLPLMLVVSMAGVADYETTTDQAEPAVAHTQVIMHAVASAFGAAPLAAQDCYECHEEWPGSPNCQGCDPEECDFCVVCVWDAGGSEFCGEQQGCYDPPFGPCGQRCDQFGEGCLHCEDEEELDQLGASLMPQSPPPFGRLPLVAPVLGRTPASWASLTAMRGVGQPHAGLVGLPGLRHVLHLAHPGVVAARARLKWRIGEPEGLAHADLPRAGIKSTPRLGRGIHLY